MQNKVIITLTFISIGFILYLYWNEIKHLKSKINNLGWCKTVTINCTFCAIPLDNSSIFLPHQAPISNLSNQPMTYHDGRFVMTYNGEIYNFLELKSELIELGYKFKTLGDTEVILASYLNWGEKCQYKFNGMWALAIWDNIEQRLFLSRDRFP